MRRRYGGASRIRHMVETARGWSRGGKPDVLRSARGLPRGRPTVPGARTLAVLTVLTLTSSRGLGAQESPRVVVRTMFGEVALEIRVARAGIISVGAADARRAVTLDVRATDAGRWADSATRLLSLKEPRRRTPGRDTAASAPPVVSRRAALEEPGVGAGSFVLARTDSAGRAFFAFFAADADLTGVRQTLEPEEARTLVRLVRRAVAAASPPRKRPRTGAKRPRTGAKRLPKAPGAAVKPEAPPPVA